MLSVLMVLAGLQDAGPVAAAAAGVQEAPVGATVAEASAPRVVRARSPVSGYSPAGDAAGHTGRVVVEAEVLADGAFGPAVVVSSSRSELLDAAAIETVRTARVPPPPGPLRMQVTVEFNPTDMLNMKCDEFARQVRWYEAAWPERTFQDPTIYVMSVGVMSLGLMQQTSDLNVLVAPARTIERLWPQIVADCERQPSRSYLQVLRARVN